jgi:hypothetical protein
MRSPTLLMLHSGVAARTDDCPANVCVSGYLRVTSCKLCAINWPSWSPHDRITAQKVSETANAD